jgi:hypothetical protein
MKATSKKTGIATSRPVTPRAQGARSSPAARSRPWATPAAPPERWRRAPNIAPTPITTAM